MANAVPEWVLWAKPLISKHEKLADQVEQDTEARRVLERDLKDLSASHNALHKELNDRVQSLSETFGKLEEKCEISFQRNEQRMSKLESEQRKIFNATDRILNAEEAFERQRQEIAEWKEQWDQAAAQANERHRQETNGPRKQIKNFSFTAQNQDLSDLPQPSGKIASSAELTRRTLGARPSDFVIDAHSQASTTDDEETSVPRYSPEQQDTRPPRKRPRKTPSLARDGANHITSPSRSSESSVTTASGESRPKQPLREFDTSRAISESSKVLAYRNQRSLSGQNHELSTASNQGFNEKVPTIRSLSKSPASEGSRVKQSLRRFDPPQAISESSEVLASLNQGSSSEQNHGYTAASDQEFNGEVPTIRSLSNGPTHADGSNTSLEHDAPMKTGLNFRENVEEPREPTPKTHTDIQQLMKIPPQSWYSLEEYLVTGDEKIPFRLQALERKVIQNYVDGMNDEKQRYSLITKLDQNGWTWKVTQQELRAISNATRKQEAEARTREAKKNAKHETQPTRSSQRNKRKINYRL